MQKIIILLAILFPISLFGFDTAAKNAYVIDVSTGTIMLDKDSEAAKPPASMSKLMTIEIVFKALKEGKLSLDTTFPVSEKAWRMGGSKMFVELGSSISVGDLLQGIIVQSGNDACVVIAEGIAGTEDRFAELMDERALALGLKESTFGNSSGWPHPRQRMSAQDLAKLAYHLATEYPDYLHYFSQPDFTYNGISQNNRNPLLGVVNGANGFKTGHTEEAGYGLVGSVERGGRHVIFVLMGLSSQAERADEAQRLATWALEGFHATTHFKAGETIVNAPTWLGEKPEIALTTAIDFVTLDPITSDDFAKATLVFDAPIPTPISEGAELGSILIQPDDAPEYNIPLYAAEDVARGSFFTRYKSVAKAFIQERLGQN